MFYIPLALIRVLVAWQGWVIPNLDYFCAHIHASLHNIGGVITESKCRQKVLYIAKTDH